MEYKVKSPLTPISINPTLSTSSSSPTTSPHLPQFSPDININGADNNCPPMILTPCAACKILRRRCVEKCILAPYFPPTDPFKFTIAHRVFGASNIIKFLQKNIVSRDKSQLVAKDLPESHRADAVSSMVYEANARIRDPVYGCAGAICQLQKQVTELQEQLARAQAELVNLHCQQTNLVALIRMSQFQDPSDDTTTAFDHQRFEIDKSGLLDDGCSLSSAEWPESLWAIS